MFSETDYIRLQVESAIMHRTLQCLGEKRREDYRFWPAVLITRSRVLNDPAVHHVSVSASCVSSRPGLTKHANPNPLPMKSYHYCCHCGKVMFIIVGQIVYSNQLVSLVNNVGLA